MKNIKAYEFKDLSKEIQEKVFDRALNNEIEFQLECLWRGVEDGLMQEDEAYKVIGCTKYYAESTAWFVPSVYYEHHKKEVEKEVRKQLKENLFNSFGVSI